MIAKKLLTTIAFAFVLLFSGCAKDDFVEIDSVCPLVVSTVPENNATEVPLNQVITATFNEKMDPSTISKASFTVTDNGALAKSSSTVADNGVLIDGTVTYTDSTATFTPSSLLDYETEYTGTIKTTAKDLRGNALQEDYVWTFTTVDLPIEFTVALSVDPVDSGLTSGFGLFDEGSEVNVIATPAIGYTFVNWTTAAGDEVSITADYTFTLIENTTLVANFTAVVSTFSLNITGVNGTVAKNPNAATYNNGDTVELTANPDPGYEFTSWSGNATGSVNPLTVTMNSDKNITANFSLVGTTFTLNVTGVNGTVAKNPDTATYNNGDTVELTANPDPGYEFTSWSGNATGSVNPLTVTMNSDKNITANFSLVGTTFTLNVTGVNGTVAKNPDTATYNNGDTVELTANPDSGYEFSSWSGDASGAVNPLTVTMNSNKNINAIFTLTGVAAGPGAIDLGTAGDFVILSKSGIDRVGVTSITGNIGVSPIDQTAITGFSQTMDVTNTFSTSTYVNGKIYAADYTAPTPAYLTTAISDQETAFTTANGLTTNVIVDLGAGDVSGMTLAPGLYKWGTGLLITNAGVTLSGGPDDTWVFQISDDFTINNDAIITLAGGAQAKNIFWVTSTQALLGSNVQFKGNILAQTLISVNTGTDVLGILLSQTAVTLNTATVVKP